MANFNSKAINMGCSPYTCNKEMSHDSQIRENSNRALSGKIIILKSSISKEFSHKEDSRIQEKSLSSKLGDNTHASEAPSLNEMLGTMPISIIIDQLCRFHNEIEKSNGNYLEIIEYIRIILNDLSNSLADSTYRIIKKNNSQFKNLIGRYLRGVPFLATLGFKDKEDRIEIENCLYSQNAKHKIKEFEHAVKRVAFKISRNS